MNPIAVVARCPRRCAALLLAAVILAGPTVSISSAQSGSRRGPAGSSNRAPAVSPGSGSRLPQSGSAQRDVASLALDGFCPVCITEMKKWVRGNAQHTATYDGKRYHFPSAEVRDKFLADPARYVPALGGDCTVCLARMGKRVPGTVQHSAFHKGRLYLFPSEDQKQAFLAEPATFADVDLAAGGVCTVCRVEIGKDVPGKPEIAAYYKGMRYLFPAEEQRKMFLANPERYAVKADGKTSAIVPNSPATKTVAAGDAAETVTVTGRSGCAGCDYGVTPIHSDELGLAVRSQDGTVYVVEDAHKQTPELYRKRFDGLTVSVQGTVIRRDGRFVWIQPEEIRTLTTASR